MRISQWGEYGILFSVYIARKELEQSPVVGAAEIASAHNIAVHYAQQILQRLRRGSVIVSVRGPQGGYRLARAANEINLLDVLVATEGSGFEVICESKPISSQYCAGETPCPLKPIWGSLREHVESFLRGNSLDMVLSMGSLDNTAISNGADSFEIAGASNFSGN